VFHPVSLGVLQVWPGVRPQPPALGGRGGSRLDGWRLCRLPRRMPFAQPFGCRHPPEAHCSGPVRGMRRAALHRPTAPSPPTDRPALVGDCFS